MKKPIILANWKMSLNKNSLDRFLDKFDLPNESLKKVNVLLGPSYPFLKYVADKAGVAGIKICAQNIFWEAEGAYTGEVSAQQVSDIGCDYTLIGHSERRNIFNEDDAIVNKKVLLALKHGVSPIICLSESLEEKEQGLTKKIIEQKVRACLYEVRSHEIKKVILGYDPVWAISTTSTNVGKEAGDPESIQVIHKFIRRIVEDMYDAGAARKMSVIYGGSVNPDNVSGIASMEDIDGVIAGGASKDADKFTKIIEAFINK